jgi:hypothetical protein
MNIYIMYLFTYVYMYVLHIYLHMCVLFIYVCTRVFMYECVCMYVLCIDYVRMNICMYICMCICMYICMYVCDSFSRYAVFCCYSVTEQCVLVCNAPYFRSFALLILISTPWAELC